MEEEVQAQVRLWDIFHYFLRLGCLGFGGPIALVGYMQKDLVERDKWVTQEEFSQGVALGATLPGPLAAQVAMWIGYLRQGFWGCTVASIGLIAPPFCIVLVIAAVYVQFEHAQWIRALFYGIGPAIAALIAESCYRLGKQYLPDWKMVTLALVCLLVTVIVHAELVILFIVGGVVGILLYAPSRRAKGGKPSPPSVLPLVMLTGINLLRGAKLGLLTKLGIFFFKAGAFTFGSGLAVAPFIYQGAVLEYKWLTEREFLDTVAVGMITPGPVVIMATFAGYLVQGFWGSFIASLGVFLPIYLMVIFVAPYLLKHHDHPQVSAFVKGATSAAIGVISGAAVIIGKGVITDWPTVLLAVISLLLVIRWKVRGLLLVAGAGLVGLLLYH
ncbi:MAG: chromate efflux transporter [Candidatus Latescibacteria bacterium]|nr:chromate efflux transporter [Candidatus Latescibacterota bacterium]